MYFIQRLLLNSKLMQQISQIFSYITFITKFKCIFENITITIITITIITIIIITIITIIIIIIISDSNWTEWSTIQGIIARVISKSDEREARGRFEITSTITP